MYRCHDCDWVFSESEAGVYSVPGHRFCTGEDIDRENEPCCPECGSLNIEVYPDDEEDDES